jgi:ABC-2 type transport system permease protein
MIDGFRFGFIDHADGSLVTGAVMMVTVDAVLALWCWRLFATGYKLKA